MRDKKDKAGSHVFKPYVTTRECAGVSKRLTVEFFGMGRFLLDCRHELKW